MYSDGRTWSIGRTRPVFVCTHFYSPDERGTRLDVMNINSRVVVCRRRTSDNEAKTFHFKRTQGETDKNENERILPKFPKSIRPQ